MADLTPIRREILVSADPETAFLVFTEKIGTWWPLAELSVHGAEASVAFVGETLVESAPGAPDAIWGRVSVWDPPSRLVFSWHPGRPPERASEVAVTFTEAGDRTLVRLEHAGWERFDDPALARAEYEHGWPLVLESYRDAFSIDDDSASDTTDDEWTWVALLHRPGPAAEGVTQLFQDPRFMEHLAFLERMRDAKQLVAAGPLDDEPGAGMTILRLPGAGRLEDAARLATVEDTSVAEGFFTVDVRPWTVMLEGLSATAE